MYLDMKLVENLSRRRFFEGYIYRWLFREKQEDTLGLDSPVKVHDYLIRRQQRIRTILDKLIEHYFDYFLDEDFCGSESPDESEQEACYWAAVLLAEDVIRSRLLRFG